MKPTYRPHILALGLLMLTSCGVQRSSTAPSRSAESVRVSPSASLQERLSERLTATPSYAPVLRGNIQAELRLGKDVFSTKVNATIQRGQTIYWSVVPFPLIEAARIWFTQSGVTAIDRMHGRYAEVSYEELSALLGFPIGYAEVEQLLLGKPFIPQGARGLRGGAYSVTEAADHSTQVDASLTVDRGQAQGKYLLSWLLTPSLQPTRFVVQEQAGAKKPIFSLQYSHSEASASKEISETTALYLGASSSPLPALRLDWSKLRPFTGTLPDLTPRIKDSYQRMTLPQLLKLFPSL